RIAKKAVGDGQRPMFGADARTVAVIGAQMAEDKAIDRGGAAAQDEHRLAFADRVVEDRGSGVDRAIGDRSRSLDGAFVIDAGGNEDGAVLVTDRGDGI